MPVSSPLEIYGTFTSPNEVLHSRKSNLTQAILEIQRDVTMAASAEAFINRGDADREGSREEKQPSTSPRLLYQVNGVAGFTPTKATVTTAITYTDVHSAEICKPKVDVVNLMWKLLLPPEAKDPSMAPVAMDPDFRGLLRRPDPPPERFRGLRKRKRAIATRTVSSTGLETQHLWRDDLSFFSIDNVRDPISCPESYSAPPNVSLSRLKTYSLDGQMDNSQDQGLELLFYPGKAAPEPPAKGLYCYECQNGKGRCFCYYELRVEKCCICTKVREFCKCSPNERLRGSYNHRPSDATGAREGRRARSGTYVGEVGASLGLRIGGVALRGGVGDSWELKVYEKERGRQRQRESEVLMIPLAAPSVVGTFGSPPKVFGSPPKVSSPLKFGESLAGDDEERIATEVDDDPADIELLPLAAASSGVFMGRRLVPPDMRRMQNAWMCVCGRCGSTIVCSRMTY